MTNEKKPRKPWTRLEWGIFIAAAALVLLGLMGWRFFGLGDVLRFAERVLHRGWHFFTSMLDNGLRLIRRIF